MVSQCTTFHVPRRKKFSTLAILCLFTEIYSNNMELYSAKVKKFSSGHSQRLPLLYVAYEHTHVVRPDVLFCVLLWLSSFSNVAWSPFFVSSYTCTPFFYMTTNPLLWIYVHEYTKMYFPCPLSLDIWILPFFFHLINCNKYPCNII